MKIQIAGILCAEALVAGCVPVAEFAGGPRSEDRSAREAAALAKIRGR